MFANIRIPINCTSRDLVEVIPADSEKGPIDIWLDGFEFPDMPKGADEVYKVKGIKCYVGPGYVLPYFRERKLNDLPKQKFSLK